MGEIFSKPLTAEWINRQYLRDYRIDHVVELQLLVVVMLEFELYDCMNSTFLQEGVQFTKLFNDDWNLQLKCVMENQLKNHVVEGYINWVYGLTNVPPRREDLDYITKIQEFYQTFREKITKSIQEIANNSDKFCVIENALWSLLSKRERRTPKCKIGTELRILTLEFSKLYNLDHVVELQIITQAIEESSISKIEEALAFASYFNQGWNLKPMKKKLNQEKYNNVKLYLQQYKSSSWIIYWIMYYTIVGNSRDCILSIRNHYESNRQSVLQMINTDLKTSTLQKNTYSQIEEKLFRILTYF